MVLMLPTRRECVRPLAVIAWPDAAGSVGLGRRLRQAGWRVLFTHTASDARRLTVKLRPTVLVLAGELPDESGWLACAKLVRSRRRTRVLLVDGDEPDGDEFAAFVGAIRVPPTIAVHQLAERVLALAPAGV
jgi:CheY-like chemotaxis protein